MARGFHLGGAGGGGGSQNVFDINTIAKADWNVTAHDSSASSYSLEVSPFTAKVVGNHIGNDSRVEYTSAKAYDLSKYHNLFIRVQGVNQGTGNGGSTRKGYISIKSATDGTVRKIIDFNSSNFSFSRNIAVGDLHGDTYYIIIATSASLQTRGTAKFGCILFTADEYKLKPYRNDLYLIDADGQLQYTLTHGTEMSHIQNADNLKITESSTTASAIDRHSMFNKDLSNMLGTNKYVRIKYKTSVNNFYIGSTSAIGTAGTTGTKLPVSSSEIGTYYIALDDVLGDVYNNLCLQTSGTGAKNIEIYELAIVDDPNS